MRIRPFLAALVLPLVITGATLALVAWNRSGGRGPIVLSDREVYTALFNDDNTTATLWITWRPEGRGGAAGEVTSKPELRQGFAALALEEDVPADRSSRLVVVDVDRDAATLERRYPDGRTHIISAATISVPADGAFENGWVVSLEPMRLQVPREWTAPLAVRSYDVELWYGLRYEPWISAIRRR